MHAFLHVDREGAFAQARAVDEKRAKGEKLGRLAGVPLALKDIFAAEGIPTTVGSKLLEGWIPPYDATLTKRLKAADVVILGKTNMDEFAMGSSTENSAYGPTGNPWDLTKIPGGSGGGSSAALASFQAPLAIGTDTGGSIRQPASVTGTVGVKPTYGAVSRYGMVAFSSSLDQGGPCARTVLDAALLHEVIAGHDPLDSTSIDAPVPPVVEAARNGSVAGMRVGVVKQFRGEGYQAGVIQRFDESVELLRVAGARTSSSWTARPSTSRSPGVRPDRARPSAPPTSPASTAMRYGLRAGDDGTHSAEEVTALTREAGFGPEVKRRIILGTYALSSGYYDAYSPAAAQKVRTLITQDFDKAFEQVDVIVSPTTPTTAFAIGERADNPMAMYLADLCTIPTNLAGNAAMSLPCGLAPEDNLPVGLQIIAPVMKDDRLYKVGAAVEAAFVEKWGHPLIEEAPSL
ncbi:Asp-tRNA(Asn)/Glu-tRNA(Gln) amidotransferase subunit GatA [Streptomyces hirsutus]